MNYPGFNTQYHNQFQYQSQLRNMGQTQKPVSGDLFYGAHGENVIPTVADLSKDGAEKAKNQRENGRRNFDSYECQTCKNRKYQDGSNDPGVSFKTPTKVSPENAAGAVRAHEGEHVTRERAEAAREDRKVVSQSVTYQTAICPECGTPYVSGGTTRTVTKATPEQTRMAEKFQVGLETEKKGRYFDATA
ncbi:hypothetical protein D3Z38_06640 [Clostridiales bacterium]|nr:hypothetical protein [Clostridiales bacterium]